MASIGGLESNLRVAGMSIALYDALWTLPAEIALYREQMSFKRMTRACMLFILIRYTSIAVLIVGNVGYFSRSFTVSSCQRFFLVTPVLKVIQTMISQVILALRTIAVARQIRWVTWTVAIVCVITVTLEFLANIITRVPFRSPAGAEFTNCTSGNHKGSQIVWVHYLSAIVHDGTCLSIATGFIYSQYRKLSKNNLDALSRMLLREGVLYFTLLTATNLFNLFLYMTISGQSQSSGATLGYAFTWIMSQRILIHLQEFRHVACSRDHPPMNNPPISQSRFFISSHTKDIPRDDMELGIHVTVEESVKVDFDQDITDGLVSMHRITPRIEPESQRPEKGKRQNEMEEVDEVEEETVTMAAVEDESNKGWQVTSAGKMFPL